MALTLWNKVRTGVLGKMHQLVDDNIANTPEAYKQRIRDLEMALADLRAAVDEAVGYINGHKRRVTELQGEKAKKEADIDLLLGDDDPTNDHHAVDLQMEVDGFDTQIVELEALVQESEANRVALDKAVDQLENKHQQMVAGLRKLTLATASTRAKSRAADAAEAAVAASDAASGASIDSIAAKINHEKDVADARFDRVIGGLDTGDDPERAAALARAKAKLAARRSQIAGGATEQASATTPA